MAISFVAAGVWGGATATTRELGAPAGIVDGDLLVAVGIAADDVAIQIDEVGFIEELNITSVVGSDNSLVVATKIANSESGAYTLKVEGATSEALRGGMLLYRGVDQITPIDQAATSVVDITNSDTHDPAAIITQNDNAWVLSIIVATQAGNDPLATPPSGYLLRIENGTGGGFLDYVAVAEKIVSPAGSEDPGIWSGLTSTADSGSITMALRPAASGPSAHQMQAYQGMERMNGGFRR